MSKVFSAVIDIANLGTDADQDIFEITIPNGKKCKILSFELFSSAVAAADLELELVQRSAAGTGGTAITEEDHDRDVDGTSSCTVLSDVEAPGAAAGALRKYRWEQLGPLEYKPIPEEMIVFDESTFASLHLETNPASVAVAGTVTWEEF